MSAVINYPTEHEIQQQVFQAIRHSLGVVGLIRFMQQYDKGYGNYTLDRQEWQENYSVDSLFAEIKLDVTFNEDDSRIRTGHSPANFNVVRQIAINLLKKEGTPQLSIKRKRFLAGLDDFFREKILRAI